MLKTTKVTEAKVSITVRKTGKIYHHSMKFAKHVITRKSFVDKEDVNEYYLRHGRGWKKVTREEYLEAISPSSVKKLNDALAEELKERVMEVKT